LKEDDAQLFASISNEGILEPLIITQNNLVISGNRRLIVANCLANITEIPHCSDNFMAETEQDIYCCTKCKDDFNNAKKAASKLVQQLEVLPAEPTPDMSLPEDLNTNLQTNIQLLDQLVNGKPDGVHVTFEELDKLGLDFNSNNGQGLLYNTPNPDECTFVVYGPFRIYRITFETALIVKPQISKSC
jgi:hypothetical protein